MNSGDDIVVNMIQVFETMVLPSRDFKVKYRGVKRLPNNIFDEFQ